MAKSAIPFSFQPKLIYLFEDVTKIFGGRLWITLRTNCRYSDAQTSVILQNRHCQPPSRGVGDSLKSFVPRGPPEREREATQGREDGLGRRGARRTRHGEDGEVSERRRGYIT